MMTVRGFRLLGRRLAWMLIGAAPLGRTGASRADDDMERLKRQAREYRGTSLVPGRTLLTEPRQWAAELGSDGSWKDVDYRDQTRNF